MKRTIIVSYLLIYNLNIGMFIKLVDVFQNIECIICIM